MIETKKVSINLSDFISIPNYEELYLIDKFGNIWSINKQRLLHHRLTQNGYHRIGLFDNYHKGKDFYVHRLVAQLFIPNPRNCNEINHKDGNKANNNVDNLEWVTHSENHVHSRSVLKELIGAKNGCAKLTEEQVISIRNDRKNGLNLREIAEKYKISWENARDICSGKRWKHLAFENEKRYGHKLISSKYRGVSWDKINNKWLCIICINGKSIHLGRFISENDAAKAYNKKALELFGEKAKLNDI